MRKKNIWVLFFLLFVAEKNQNKTSDTHETIPSGVQETSALKTATNRWQRWNASTSTKQGNSEGRNPPNSD